MRGDAISIALQGVYREKKISKNKQKHGIVVIDLGDNIPKEKITKIFYEISNQMEIDLKKAKRKMIFETHEIEVEYAKKIFEPLGFDIYCLGMPNEEKKHLMKQIINNDDENDWTKRVGGMMLELTCEHIINKSEKNKEECQKYNIEFFDTSGNRKKKVDEITKIIEAKSIKE